MRTLRNFFPFILAAAMVSGAVSGMGNTPVTVGASGADSSAYQLETWPPGVHSASAIRNDEDALSAYVKVRSAGFGGWDDGSGMFIGSQLGRYPQLYRIASPGGERRQITFFPKRVSGFYPNPDPKRKNVLYSQDVGGDEEFRLALFDLAAGRSRDLDCPPGRIEGIVWNDSGTGFAYAHTPKGTDRWDIRMHYTGSNGDTGGLHPIDDTLLLSRPGTWTPLDFSPDGRYLLVQKFVSASDAEVYVLSLAGGLLTPLLPLEKPAFTENALFIRRKDAGGRPSAEDIPWDICFASDRDGEFTRLYRTHPGMAVEPVSPDAPWDVEWFDASPDRSLLIYSLNEEGVSRLYSLSPAAGKPKPLHGIPEGLINGVHFRAAPGGPREFAFMVSGASFPGDVFTYRLDAGKATRWTFSETGGLPSAAFRTPQLIRYPTFDSVPAPGASKTGASRRREIPAWLYLPDAGIAHPPFPVLILIHGGPESQARPGFEAFVQYATGHLGLAVVQPNVRGSSGYGKSYQQADDGFRRMGSVRDIGALIDWIKTRKDLDASRMAVAGRSYGGFMALSSLIEYGGPGGIRAGISTVGITHFPTFLKKTSGYRRDLRRVEYGDERDPRMAAFLDSISPLTRLDRIRSPLLLCHGRNDPRVPYQESERIFAALKAKNIPVWFLTFEDEGHAFRDQDSQMVHYRVMAEFLSRELDLRP